MNKKKKGFTLIELLAVIVILAVIALIATPAVTHIIESSRKNSAEEYAEAITKVAINYYNSLLVENNEVLALDLKDKEIDMTGARPDKGRTYFSSKGFISATMYYSGYCLEVDETGNATSRKVDAKDCKVYDSMLLLNPNGGTVAVDRIEFEKGNTLGELPEAERKGYEFLGWFTDKVGGKEITSETVIETEGFEVYAHWQVNTYTVTLTSPIDIPETIGWIVNGKTATKEVSYDSAYGTLPVLSKIGSTFKGWRTEGGSIVTSKTLVSIDKNHTLEAILDKNVYQISFNPNGGYIDTVEKSLTYEEVYGNLPTPIRNGYTFTGWYDSDGKIIKSTDIFKKLEHQELTARWTANTYIITLVYGNGISNTTRKVTYDSTYGEFPVLTRSGYTFNGWYLDTVKVEGNSKVKILADATIVAKWTPNNYKVTYVYNNGMSNTTQNVTFDGIYENMPEPTRTGYTFAGWYTSSSSGNLIKNGTKVSTSSDHTLYARWTANTYTVTLVYGNGTSNTTKSVTYNSTYGTLPTPTKTGYIFNGWSTSGGAIINASSTVSITGNHTLTAQWSKGTYLVSFNGNGATPSFATKNVTYDNTYGTLPTISRTGYTFNGWYLNGVKVTNTSVVKTSANHTLVARWTANTYIITLVYGNGTSNTTKSVTYNSTYGTLPTPTRSGYTFNGWYTSSSGGRKITSSSTVTITSNQTLYAQWIVSYSCPSGSTLINDSSKGYICTRSAEAERYYYDCNCDTCSRCARESCTERSTGRCKYDWYCSRWGSGVGVSGYGGCTGSSCCCLQESCSEYETETVCSCSRYTYYDCNCSTCSDTTYSCPSGYNVYSGSGRNMVCYKKATANA